MAVVNIANMEKALGGPLVRGAHYKVVQSSSEAALEARGYQRIGELEDLVIMCDQPHSGTKKAAAPKPAAAKPPPKREPVKPFSKPAAPAKKASK